MLDDAPARPRTRGDCLPGGCNNQRPCPWVSCAHHLAVDVVLGQVVEHFDVTDPANAERPTCALDVADGGGVTFEEAGEIQGVTRERIRQIEAKAIRRARHPSRKHLKEFLPERESRGRVRPSDYLLDMASVRRIADVVDARFAAREAERMAAQVAASKRRTAEERKARRRREETARREARQREFLATPAPMKEPL